MPVSSLYIFNVLLGLAFGSCKFNVTGLVTKLVTGVSLLSCDTTLNLQTTPRKPVFNAYATPLVDVNSTVVIMMLIVSTLRLFVVAVI